jgi:hypothetical protein
MAASVFQVEETIALMVGISCLIGAPLIAQSMAAGPRTLSPGDNMVSKG